MSKGINRRNFLLSLFFFPLFFDIFKKINKEPYFIISSIHGGIYSKQKNSPYIRRSFFEKLNNKMRSEKKLIRYESVNSKNKDSWLYIFDSKESYDEWCDNIQFLKNALPKQFKYFQIHGFVSDWPKNSVNLNLLKYIET